MEETRFYAMCLEMVLTIKKKAPKDTGNLAYNAIKFMWVNDNEFHIWVDEGIAPYMVYTNEPWVSPKWNGKKNPNEKWWDNITDIISRIIEKYCNVKEVKVS